MPHYNGIARDSKFLFIGDDQINAARWLQKNNLKWITLFMELVRGQEDPKTAEQLGYYWGLLLPEIHKQMKADGQTQTIKFKDFEKEIPITQSAAHEIITELSGYVGDNGAFMRLSDCDKDHAIIWIDNVLDFAAILRMNTNKLKAVKTKL